jgi:hypothetical protein
VHTCRMMGPVYRYREKKKARQRGLEKAAESLQARLAKIAEVKRQTTELKVGHRSPWAPACCCVCA